MDASIQTIGLRQEDDMSNYQITNQLSTKTKLSNSNTPITCRIVDQQGFYPGRLVDVGYINTYKGTLEARLEVAGQRLAGLLNRVLQP